MQYSDISAAQFIVWITLHPKKVHVINFMLLDFLMTDMSLLVLLWQQIDFPFFAATGKTRPTHADIMVELR
jgi:hypothetical protein